MARILIVEDDDSVRMLASRALETAGHAIAVAEDGERGFARISEAAGGFDLVVSDIRMPGMDGIEMAKAAAKSFPGLRVLLVTGYADQRERAADLSGVVVDVLLKPFSLVEIRGRVARALSQATETC
jgi:two-component system, cell cycle response regulator CpdR